MKDIFIKTENLCFSYADADQPDAPAVLKGIDIEIEQGTFVAVLGHNGSGKSTLAKLLNLILRRPRVKFGCRAKRSPAPT